MIMGKPVVKYILETDIKGFFDHVDHKWMRRCLEIHIGDPRFLNLITQILKAEVMEDKKLTKTTAGAPQGGIISPILANVYLHYVLDLWFSAAEQKHMRGYTQLVRYADDFVIGCQAKADAEKLMQDIVQRFAKFGLELSPETTRIIEFGRYAQGNRSNRREKRAETFDFLGFTHYCDKTRDGRFAVKVRTSKKRMKKAQQTMNKYLKQNRSVPLKELWGMTKMKLTGHYQYYGVSGTFESLKTFYGKTQNMLVKWLNRRSQKQRFNWTQFAFYNTW